MKNIQWYLFLVYVLFLSACSTLDSVTSDRNSSGVLPVDSQLLANPRAFLQELPLGKWQFYNFPYSTVKRYTVNAYNNNLHGLYMIHTIGICQATYPLADIERDLNAPVPSGMRPYYNEVGSVFHGVVMYKGTSLNPTGSTSDPIYKKMITLLAGNQTIHFGYFNDKGVNKFYSYDPASNKLTGLQAVLRIGTDLAPYPFDTFVYGLNVSSDKDTYDFFMFTVPL